ncbi:MAG: pyruvate, phosphate dikinase [Alphaproteobacteria bacterium]|nr:pyruvate, phosphate dikinase [Rickettsiales bacterium]
MFLKNNKVGFNDKCLLGGKGAHLLDMAQMGISVPAGMVIPTVECVKYFKNNFKLDQGLKNTVIETLKKIEKETSKKFGDPKNPLLLSIRSGAKVSMPGMMDTILNLGMNDEIANGMSVLYGEKFAADCYRRFLEMYTNVVLGIPSYKMEELLSDTKIQFGTLNNNKNLSVNHLHMLCDKIKKYAKLVTKCDIPSDPFEQLFVAIEAVFNSCNSKRSKIYREINNIVEEPSTAVNVQSMVFGNFEDSKSLTGVYFSRNPSDGEKCLYGEYVPNGQGEDVVSGSKTPYPISAKTMRKATELDACNSQSDPLLEETMPELFNELKKVAEKLEKHYKDMQDIEFTVEKGKLWILQTRTGKRAPKANVKIQHDLAVEGLISKESAIIRVSSDDLIAMLHPRPCLSTPHNLPIIACGLPASPGVGIGKVAFNSESVKRYTQDGYKVILVREETSPEDVEGMHLSDAILTRTGGMTSHAAVVCRGMGVPCIVGCSKIDINEEKGYFIGNNNNLVVREGDIVSIDGFAGNALLGTIQMKNPDPSAEFEEILKWADELSFVKVRANAETEKDCLTAKKFGAAGIGLARTEHMFFKSNALTELRKAIVLQDKLQVCGTLSDTVEKITELQENSFCEIFKIMGDLPINIRLLDPPLHEFLPKTDLEIQDFCKKVNIEDVETVKKIVNQNKETNPMLGLRGCRLGVKMPFLYKAQINAIFKSIIKCKNNGLNPSIEIMIPLVQCKEELLYCIKMITETKLELEKQHNTKIDYKIGTMIELPRACMVAEELAPLVSYFSFGTNDLTQTTLGISRDDGESFLPLYKSNKIVNSNPFVHIDKQGVGELLKIAIKSGKKTNQNIYFGICGEHGGDPESIRFACDIGVSYVSCSPYRVPIAKLAVAQHAISSKKLYNN